MQHDEMENRLTALRSAAEKIKRATDELTENARQRDAQLARQPDPLPSPPSPQDRLIRHIGAQLEQLAEQ